MGLEQLTLETGLNKVEVAIALLKAWEPPEGYYLAFSGGKDSVAIYDLAVKADVKFVAHYCVSPIDPPQIHKFIKDNYPDVIWDFHARGFWKLVAKNGLPLRQARWCCRIIKEAGGEGSIKILGMRRAESSGRSSYRCFSVRSDNTSWLLPILSWSEFDVWQYIREANLQVCSLYNEGFKRIGCVLCPFNRDIERELKYFPKIVNCWKRACDRIVEKRIVKGTAIHKTGQELFDWWVARK